VPRGPRSERVRGSGRGRRWSASRDSASCGSFERWKSEEYPAIRAAAEDEGATIYFADEAAGVRSDYDTGTTWSPIGRTPVVKNTGNRFSGEHDLRRFPRKARCGSRSMRGIRTQPRSPTFASGSCGDAPGPVYLIVDGHPAHRATATKEFASSPKAGSGSSSCPATPPELNAVEWVWKNVKHDRIGKTGVTSKEDLKSKAAGALRRLQKRPGLVRAFFADPHLRYITA
jgi:hypothetical protein